MVTLRRTWHVQFDTDAEELLAGVQVGMVAGPRCRTHSHAAERARTPGLDASWEFMLHVGVGDALTDLAERDLLRPVIDRAFPLAVPLTPSSTSRPGAPAARWSSPSDRASAPAQIAAWRWLVHSVTARGSRTTTAVARGRRAA
jgi:hypothetical protein